MEIEYNRINDFPFSILDLKSEDFEYSQTVTVEDGLYIDFDIEGVPIAIEMISAPKKFHILEGQFTSAQIEGKIIITGKSISLVLKILQYNRIYEIETPNIYGISLGEFEFEVAGVSTPVNSTVLI